MEDDLSKRARAAMAELENKQEEMRNQVKSLASVVTCLTEERDEAKKECMEGEVRWNPSLFLVVVESKSCRLSCGKLPMRLQTASELARCASLTSTF